MANNLPDPLPLPGLDQGAACAYDLALLSEALALLAKTRPERSVDLRSRIRARLEPKLGAAMGNPMSPTAAGRAQGREKSIDELMTEAGHPPRKLLGYGDCRCILTQYCDGTCRPIYGDPEVIP